MHNQYNCMLVRTRTSTLQRHTHAGATRVGRCRYCGYRSWVAESGFPATARKVQIECNLPRLEPRLSRWQHQLEMAAQQRASAVLVHKFQGRVERATSEATRIATRHQRHASTPRTRDTSVTSSAFDDSGGGAEDGDDADGGDPRRCQKETGALLLFLWVAWAIVGAVPGMPARWSFAGGGFPGNSLGTALCVLGAVTLLSAAFCGAMACCAHGHAADGATVQQVPNFAARPDGTRSVDFASSSVPEASRAARPKLLQLRRDAPTATPAAAQHGAQAERGAEGAMAVAAAAGASAPPESHV